MNLIIDIPDKEWEEWKNGLGIIHTKPLTDALEKAKPLQAEFEEIKAEVDNLTPLELIHKARVLTLLDNRISKLKGENNE